MDGKEGRTPTTHHFGHISMLEWGGGDSQTPKAHPYGCAVGVQREGMAKTQKTRQNGRVFCVLMEWEKRRTPKTGPIGPVFGVQAKET